MQNLILIYASQCQPQGPDQVPTPRGAPAQPRPGSRSPSVPPPLRAPPEGSVWKSRRLSLGPAALPPPRSARVWAAAVPGGGRGGRPSGGRTAGPRSGPRSAAAAAPGKRRREIRAAPPRPPLPGAGSATSRAGAGAGRVAAGLRGAGRDEGRRGRLGGDRGPLQAAGRSGLPGSGEPPGPARLRASRCLCRRPGTCPARGARGRVCWFLPGPWLGLVVVVCVLSKISDFRTALSLWGYCYVRVACLHLCVCVCLLERNTGI